MNVPEVKIIELYRISIAYVMQVILETSLSSQSLAKYVIYSVGNYTGLLASFALVLVALLTDAHNCLGLASLNLASCLLRVSQIRRLIFFS